MSEKQSSTFLEVGETALPLGHSLAIEGKPKISIKATKPEIIAPKKSHCKCFLASTLTIFYRYI